MTTYPAKQYRLFLNNQLISGFMEQADIKLDDVMFHSDSNAYILDKIPTLIFTLDKKSPSNNIISQAIEDGYSISFELLCSDNSVVLQGEVILSCYNSIENEWQLGLSTDAEKKGLREWKKQ